MLTVKALRELIAHMPDHAEIIAWTPDDESRAYYIVETDDQPSGDNTPTLHLYLGDA